MLKSLLALTVEDAQAMVSAAEKAQKPLMVGHLIRHHAGFQELCRLVKTGAIGGIRHLRLSRIAPGRSVTANLYCLIFAP